MLSNPRLKEILFMTKEEFHKKVIISARIARAAGLGSAARTLERIAVSCRQEKEISPLLVKTEIKILRSTKYELTQSTK